MLKNVEMQWWLERFGGFGRRVHDICIDSIRVAHDEHANAQAQISYPSRRVYGSVNWGAQHHLAVGLRKHAEVSFVAPKPRAAKLPIVNGRAVVVWRYSNRDGIDVLLKKFATSDSRIATFNMQPVATQPSLGPEVDADLGLTEEDKAFLKEISSVVLEAQESGESCPVVVVAYASNPNGIFKAVAADALLLDDETLNLMNVHRLDNFGQEALNSTPEKTTKRFDLAPRKPLVLMPKSVNEE